MSRKALWINKKYISLCFQTKTTYTEWFGYYNYDVMNYDGSRMLCNRASFEGRDVEPSDTIELGWYDINTGKWYSIGHTNSFNWPQGAMLQWLPNNRTEVIYNRSENGHFESVIHNTDSLENRVLDYPIYCVHPNGDFALTLNYERSYWCRAYHYQSVVNEKYNVRIAEDDGVYKLAFGTGKLTRIISINDIVAIDSIPEFNNCKHWLEHVMLNPSGSRLAVLHRFSTVDGYGTRIVTALTDGSELSVVDGWQNHDYSHLGWINDDSFAIYSVVRLSPYVFETNGDRNKVSVGTKESASIRFKKTVRKVIAPRFIDQIRGRKKGYDIFQANNSGFRYDRTLDQSVFSIDGHPSFTKDGRFMITDTYPDNKGYRRLIIYNMQENVSIIVGKFYSPLRRTPAACDLHPKLCFNDNMVIVDSACFGKHSMLAFNINWSVVEKRMRHHKRNVII